MKIRGNSSHQLIMVKLKPNTFWFPVVVVIVLTFVDESNSAYDFIVVGSGAGGSAVARRLAENGKFNVLVIESGGMPKEGYDIPAYVTNYLGDSEMTFGYQSIPQQNAGLFSNGTMSVVAGRTLGGTTSVNYMWFNRGHPLDWDNWASITGDDSWRYKNMLKYFKRVETYEGEFPSDQHGKHGPVTVSRPRYSPGLDYWFRAARELGYSIGDPNGPQKLGFHPVEFAKRHGRRSSSFTSYLKPILNYPNLRIMTNTNATQILFTGNKAVGVRFITNSSNSQGTFNNIAYATKEIIVSAGAFGSPLLLQRSGIGPRAVLSGAKIPIVKELPVGLNYQDHATINLNFLINNHSVVMDDEKDLNQHNWELYNTYGDGPFSNTRGATGQAMIATSVTRAEGYPDWPDVQLLMSHSTEPYLLGDELHDTVNITGGETQISSSVYMGRAKSRGSIAINATDPVLGNPVLDMGYLTDPRDMQMFLDGIVEVLKIYEHTKAYQSLAATYAPVDLPNCVQFPVKSKDYWVCYIQNAIQGGCHPAGTNKMGKPTDPNSVVDSELKVIGIEGLRVVDASIMPFITNANPHAAVYGIAEKAADMILGKWGSTLDILRGGTFQGNSLFGDDEHSHRGRNVQPLRVSMKQSPFQQSSYQQQPYFPQFPQRQYFQHKPQFHQKPVIHHQPQIQQQPQSSLFGEDGDSVHPSPGVSLKPPPFMEQPNFPQFPQRPFVQHKPLKQKQPEIHHESENKKEKEGISLADKLNILRNIFGFISRTAKVIGSL